MLFITSCTRTHLYGVENRIESERSSKDNEEREGIEEGAQKNFGFSKFASKRSFKRSSTASTSF